MAINYKRRQANVNNRNWVDYTEKQNAKYMASQLKALGYKIPAYMKKGNISEKQLNYYLDRIENRLDKEVNKEYKDSLSRSERTQFNRLNKIIVDRGGKRNDRELINNAIKIADTLKQYSNYINKMDKKNTELQDVNKWIELGFTSAETLLQNVHPALIKSKINKLESMVETLNNLTSVSHIQDYLDRIGASEQYRKSITKRFNKLNIGQKILFNTATWEEFKLQYNEDSYHEATTLEARRKYLENVLEDAINTFF